MVSYDEARKATLKYFNDEELCADVWLGKYALRNNDGELQEKTPDDMHRRLAREFARIEQKYPNPLSEEDIYEYIKNFSQIIPQGSPMAGIGNPYQLMSLSNCIVIDPPHDSYAGILHTDQEQVQLMKRRCGVGFDISNIRPKGLKTHNAAGTTDGIGVFMERFSNSCREVAQGGRRGALMLSISVHHPEIETFLLIKRDLKKVTGANISIRFTNEFMRAVENDTQYELRFPVDSENPTISKMVSARHIWNLFIESNHKSAEPGALFWDTVLEMTPAEAYASKGFHHVGVNPCAELILSAGDSCRLLLVNVSAFVRDAFKKSAHFDWVAFRKAVRVAQRLMDDIIDLEIECIDKILSKISADPEPEHVKRIERDLWLKLREACVNGRRTGLGQTALGDAIAGMNLRYGSDESIDFVDKVYKELAIGSYEESINLAKERGAFPVFEHRLEKDHPFIKRILEAAPHLVEDYLLYGRRNIANLTTAPCGSASILARLFDTSYHNTTSGIECAYLLWFIRRKKINPNDRESRVDFVDEMGDKWQEYKVYHNGYKYWKEVNGKTDDDVEESHYWGGTSNDIDWKQSVKLQAAAQKWVDHSISKTCNLPADATQELMSEVYLDAWRSGCKGFTTYRDGCRSGVLVSEPAKPTNDAPKRPKDLPCDIYKTTIKGTQYHVLVGLHQGKPYEVMVCCGEHPELKGLKSGTLRRKSRGHYMLLNDEEVIIDNITESCSPGEDALTRMTSMLLRHNIGLEHIQTQLLKSRDSINSFAKAISRCLKPYLEENAKASGVECPNCKITLSFEEGCMTCKSCGYSKC